MSNFLRRLRGQRGAALVEYALIASLIALPSVAVMEAISDTMNDEFNTIEDNAASAGHGTTTTAAPGATTTTVAAGTTTTTTTAAPGTTTTTTAAPATTTTTSTTTTTTIPATTTTGPTTTTTAPAAPAYQSQTVSTASGTWTFQVINGVISLDSYSINRGWSGSYHYEPDGSMVLELSKRWRSETVTAWLDDDGYLHVTVS